MLIAGIVLAAQVVAQQLPQGLQVFDFKGIRADQVVPNPRAIGLNVCSHDKRANEWTCMPGMTVANRFAVTVWHFKDDLLSSLEISGGRSDYSLFRDAFTERYGQPCRQTTEKWQNAMGASLDNHVAIWCFSTGELELREIGDRITSTEATYVRGGFKQPKPQIDF